MENPPVSGNSLHSYQMSEPLGSRGFRSGTIYNNNYVFAKKMMNEFVKSKLNTIYKISGFCFLTPAPYYAI